MHAWLLNAENKLRIHNKDYIQLKHTTVYDTPVCEQLGFFELSSHCFNCRTAWYCVTRASAANGRNERVQSYIYCCASLCLHTNTQVNSCLQHVVLLTEGCCNKWSISQQIHVWRHSSRVWRSLVTCEVEQGETDERQARQSAQTTSTAPNSRSDGREGCRHGGRSRDGRRQCNVGRRGWRQCGASSERLTHYRWQYDEQDCQWNGSNCRHSHFRVLLVD